jgi:Uma2 family endonuclease
MLGRAAFFSVAYEINRRRMPTQTLQSSEHAPRQPITEDGCGMRMSTATKRWTLDELHGLPDDGNKYELIDGDLFVTPAPSDYHETLGAKLTRWLDPFVARHGLGYVYRPRAIVQIGESEVEPDLMVRQTQASKNADWKDAPRPILVIEILSPTTRRRDSMQKRDFYMRIGIAEYWIVDPERQTVTAVRAGEPDRVEGMRLDWKPDGVNESLEIDLYELFDIGPDNPPGARFLADWH